MGIKSLSKFLKSNYPELIERIHISEYYSKQIAIDTTLYLCNYKVFFGNDTYDWIKGFTNLINCFRRNNVHCVFIFDGSSPIEKTNEKKKRYERRNKMEDKVKNIEEALEKYENEGLIDDILLEFQEKRKIVTRRLISDKEDVINTSGIKFEINKMKKQLFSIYPEDYIVLKNFLDILNIPYLVASQESDTLCSDLCIQGKVDAVLSEDTDMLAYGSSNFLTNFNIFDDTCNRINFEKLLQILNLDKNSFLDFCIMCGTDYNQNIFRIGPNKAYNLILKYKNIETVEKEEKLDIEILNHKVTRELFKNYSKTKIKKIKYCGIPNFEKLIEFCKDKKIFLDIEKIKDSLKNEIKFEN